MKGIVFAAVLISAFLFVVLVVFGQETSRITPQYAEWPPTSGTYWFLMDRVIDGDTIAAHILVPVRGRLHGIDAEELRDRDPEKRKAAQKAKDALAGKLKYGQRFRARVYGKDDFGRTLMTPYDDDGKSVCDFLLLHGLAREYTNKD